MSSKIRGIKDGGILGWVVLSKSVQNTWFRSIGGFSGFPQIILE